LAALSPDLFRQALNSIRHSTNNNDLLEFIGDRAINLVCALLVDKEKVCPDQQIFVARKISNNDTLGRLAWWLHLDKYAVLSCQDAHAIRTWSPRRKGAPPKVLADLFESVVGAYCLERGWPALLSWLEPFFKPLMELSTQDF
ncbi:ribonuclease III domain-containing protein, partial [Mycena galopus ATCC 62051]